MSTHRYLHHRGEGALFRHCGVRVGAVEGQTCYTMSVPAFACDSLQHSIVEAYVSTGSSHTVSLQLSTSLFPKVFSNATVHTDSVYADSW